MKLWFRRQNSSDEEDDNDDDDEEIPEAEVRWERLQCAASCVMAKSVAVLQLWLLYNFYQTSWALRVDICWMSLLRGPRRASGYSGVYLLMCCVYAL
jgi:hypothetical protein